MYVFLTVIIVIASVLVTLFVLVQKSKGGGLASGFASANQVMGAPKTADFLEKTTWGLIAVIALLSVFAVGAHKNLTTDNHESQVIEQAAENVGAMQQTAAPAFGEDEASQEEN